MGRASAGDEGAAAGLDAIGKKRGTGPGRQGFEDFQKQEQGSLSKKRQGWRPGASLPLKFDYSGVFSVGFSAIFFAPDLV